ncbi:hypothetical protein [Arachidicoccus terrestris]|uniref:hypothetical protein n=1 Tax=Arachidicoccus terrestris TaxID=2875539 RepID=UPI001CC4527B|nr:hypothetical protein [Arachidicoccus terrestris]UAY55717.1 hypothetical protein K9M52_01400 [Arachidicoccus terrestris]
MKFIRKDNKAFLFIWLCPLILLIIASRNQTFLYKFYEIIGIHVQYYDEQVYEDDQDSEYYGYHPGGWTTKTWVRGVYSSDQKAINKIELITSFFFWSYLFIPGYFYRRTLIKDTETE